MLKIKNETKLIYSRSKRPAGNKLKPEEIIMAQTYLTTSELSERIKYNPRTIRNQLKDSVLLEGVHYIRPFGGRKILYVWEQIEQDMIKPVGLNQLMAGIQ
mgnify:CR=1 FL=1